jgi:hypothetical protein
MEEHCKRTLNNDKAYIEKVKLFMHQYFTSFDACKKIYNFKFHSSSQADTYNCKTMRCLLPGDPGSGIIWIHNVAPVENVICGDGLDRGVLTVNIGV